MIKRHDELLSRLVHRSLGVMAEFVGKISGRMPEMVMPISKEEAFDLYFIYSYDRAVERKEEISNLGIDGPCSFIRYLCDGKPFHAFSCRLTVSDDVPPLRAS